MLDPPYVSDTSYEPRAISYELFSNCFSFLSLLVNPAERLGTVPYSLVARHSLLVAFSYSQSVYILV